MSLSFGELIDLYLGVSKVISVFQTFTPKVSLCIHLETIIPLFYYIIVHLLVCEKVFM